MENTIRIQKSAFSIAITIASVCLPLSAIADFEIISRNSELRLASTNMAGVAITLDSTDTATPFFAHLQDSTSHIEPGGNINGGIWNGMQESSVSPNLIRAEMHSEVVTELLFGNGSPILDMLNEFEVEFEVSDTTEIELGGTFLGTADTIATNDFVRIRLQVHNGITFLTMFETSSLDDLNALFFTTFQPGTRYRLIAESHADAFGAQASSSNLSVCLRPRSSTGDMNLDGLVNLLDINPFVEAITSGIYQGQADTNCDGLVDLTDVAPFVELLNGN